MTSSPKVAIREHWFSRRLSQVLPDGQRRWSGPRRRVGDYQARGVAVSFESVLRDQRERDARDAARAIAPMKPAADAVVIDSSGLSVEAVVDLHGRRDRKPPGQAASPVETSRGTPS